MFAPPVAKVRGKAPASSIPQSAYSPPMFRPTRHHDCDPLGKTPGEPASRASWDLSVIPIFSPDGASQTEPPAPRRAPPLPAALQTKLAIGAVDDPLEHEANCVADQVMRMPALEVASTATPPQISRKCEMCEQEEKVQRKEVGTTAPGLTEAPANVHEVLRSPGQPLDEATRAYFSKVRVHTDIRANESAVCDRARHLLGENLSAPCLGQRVALQGKVLVYGRHAGIADQHRFRCDVAGIG
jgi:hypothetical protein